MSKEKIPGKTWTQTIVAFPATLREAFKKKPLEVLDEHADPEHFGVGGSDCYLTGPIHSWEETPAGQRQLLEVKRG